MSDDTRTNTNRTDKDVPAIPMPMADVRSLVATCIALKQAVEVLASRRG